MKATNRHWKHGFLSFFVVVVSCVGSVSAQAASGVPASLSQLPLLHQSDLEYKGAFKIPDGVFGKSNFNYGGTAPAFNPANNSLFLVGHDWDQMVAEIKIPQIKNSNQLSDLATAVVLQNFVDASEGKMFTVGPNTVKAGGLMVYGGKLYGSDYLYYDGAGEQSLSHFVTSLDLSKNGDVQGMYKIGDVGAGFVSGYMTPIPDEWQSVFGGPALTGQCCIAIVSRTSYGPSLSVFDPADLGTKNPVPATPVVYYPSTHTTLGAWDSDSTLFNGNTQIRGVLFAPGTRSVLFFGTQGKGAFCYGTGGAKGECYDLANDSKGVHGYPYVYQVWAYDALDLIAVKNGTKQPWDIQPYATWNMDLPFSGTTDNKQVGGVAYDSKTKQIYFSQMYGNDTLPVIHVLTVKSATAEAAPATPTPPVTPVPVATPPAVVPPTSQQAAQCHGLTKSYYPKKNSSLSSVMWRGYVRPQFTEEYTFFTTAKKARVWVKGKKIIDNSKNTVGGDAAGRIKLKAGKTYSIKILSTETQGDASAELSWSSPHLAKQIIPTESLFSSAKCVQTVAQ